MYCMHMYVSVCMYMYVCMYIGLHKGFLFVREGKESIMYSTLLLGGRRGPGVCSPKKGFNLGSLRLLLVASGVPEGL